MKTTPLIEAIDAYQNDAVKLLIELGANINDSLAFPDEPPLSIAYGCSNTEAVRLLLDAGAKTEAIELHIFADYCHDNVDIFKLLLDHGSDPFIDDGRRNLPYSLCEYDLIECLKYYDERLCGGRLKFDIDLLYWATWRGSSNATRFLIERGVDLNHEYIDGMTCLHAMCVRSMEEIHGDEENLHKTVQVLADAGIDFYKTDNKYRTALDVAMDEGRNDMVEILKDYMK